MIAELYALSSMLTMPLITLRNRCWGLIASARAAARPMAGEQSGAIMDASAFCLDAEAAQLAVQG